MENYTLLLVEDDIETRKNYVNILKRDFKNVFEAGDGIEALQIYNTKKPDILIIDIDIPKMNGIEFLEQVRCNDLNTKAIMFTSHSDRDTLLKLSTLKLTQYLIKPVRRSNFKDALNQALDELRNYRISSNQILKLSNEYSWNLLSEELHSQQGIVKLTKTEKNIFSMVAKNSLKNQITTYEDIVYSLWDEYSENNLKSLKTIVSTLRKKLPEDTIINEYGMGYKLG
jgi:DNA-binding response OmpR family regulator